MVEDFARWIQGFVGTSHMRIDRKFIGHRLYAGIHFYARGSAPERCREWIRKHHVEYMRMSIEQKGSVRIKLHKEDWKVITQIAEIPEPGEAVPDYNFAFGDVFSYTFSPTGLRWKLSVRGVLSSLEITNGDDIGCEWLPESKVPRPEENMFTVPFKSVIAGADYQKLWDIGWRPDKIKSYSYSFVPSTVGTFISVEDLESGERAHLTDLKNW